MCRFGFHKWRNYGKEVEVFWPEPPDAIIGGSYMGRRHETVYEGHRCSRCGLKLRRVFATNSDGTLSCVGWEPDT